MKVLIPNAAIDDVYLTYDAILQLFRKLPNYWKKDPYALIENDLVPNEPCRYDMPLSQFSYTDLDFLKHTMPTHPFGIEVNATGTKFYIRPMPPDVVVIYIIGKTRNAPEIIVYKHNHFSTKYHYVYENSKAVKSHTGLYIIGSTEVDGLSIRLDANQCDTIDGEVVWDSIYGYFIRDSNVENDRVIPSLGTDLITDQRLNPEKLAAITNGVLDFNQVPVLDTQATAMMYSCLDET